MGNWRRLLMIALTATTVQASALGSDQDWSSPRIPGYGAAKPMPNAAVPFEKERTYKVLFSLSQASSGPGQPLPGLVRAARLLNLAALAEVPEEQMKVAVVLQGPATFAVLQDKYYRRRMDSANPNLDLLDKLKAAGVEIFVCGQALAHLKLDPEWVSTDVKVAVSALNVMVDYQMKGYALIQD